MAWSGTEITAVVSRHVGVRWMLRVEVGPKYCAVLGRVDDHANPRLVLHADKPVLRDADGSPVFSIVVDTGSEDAMRKSYEKLTKYLP